MKVGSLFSGYGGLDLAVEHVFGARTVWHVEFEAAPSAVLAQRWPGVPNLGDVTRVDWSAVEPVDILTGGYPCQPFSAAGRRKGTTDERHLWPYVRTAIRVLRPCYAILENVAGHRSLGFDRVLGDLAEDGHDARWVSVRASDIGAPHRRERLFVLVDCYAHAAGVGLGAGQQPVAGEPEVAEHHGGRLPLRDADSGDRDGRPAERGSGPQGSTTRPTADTRGETRVGGAGLRESFASRLGWGRPDDRRVPTDWGRYTDAVRRWETVVGAAPAPTQLSRTGTQQLSPVFVEWMMGLPRGWVTDVAVPVDDGDQLNLFGDALRPPPVDLARNAELKMLGNGVVPLQAIHAIEQLMEIQ
ncbi:DNA methyltransferase [Gordonia Phage SchottB]|nr:DNA methyltransferase [Gordonia Phage SchottB]